MQTYVDNLNKLIVGTEWEKVSLLHIVKDSDGALFNNAGQVLNHNLYFQQFTARSTGKPEGNLALAIEKEWNSFENFKTEFVKAGTTLFGSGWVWLTKDTTGKLAIKQYANAGNPVKEALPGRRPLKSGEMVECWQTRKAVVTTFNYAEKHCSDQSQCCKESEVLEKS